MTTLTRLDRPPPIRAPCTNCNAPGLVLASSGAKTPWLYCANCGQTTPAPARSRWTADNQLTLFPERTRPMETKPVDPTRRLDTLFPSPWLRASNLLEHHRPQVTLTVKELRIVTVQPKPNQPEDKPALFFHETSLGYLLNKTDTAALAAAGLTTVADVIGAKVTIALETFRGKNVLRIKSAARPQPAPQPAAQPDPPPVTTAAPPPAEPAPASQDEPEPAATGGATGPQPARNRPATATATTFWQLARAHADRIDRPTALAIIAAFPNDWPAAVKAMEELIDQPA